MIEIQQKLFELILTTSHILCMKIRANNKKINCNKFVSKKDSDYFFTGVYNRRMQLKKLYNKNLNMYELMIHNLQHNPSRKPPLNGLLVIQILCTSVFHSQRLHPFKSYQHKSAVFNKKVYLVEMSKPSYCIQVMLWVSCSQSPATILYRNMMTSSNGNIFRVTGHLCGEFTGPGEFPAQRPVTRSFDAFFDLRLNKRLSKQSWGWWFETLSRPLWRHRNENALLD